MRQLGDAALSSLSGELLMVGVVVVAAAGGWIAWAPDSPPDEVHANLATYVDCGSGVWGDGDEAVIIEHRGGEPIPMTEAVFGAAMDGKNERVSLGDSQAGPLDDGFLTIGERFAVGAELTESTAVKVRLDVAHSGDKEARTMLAQTVIERRCFQDSVARVAFVGACGVEPVAARLASNPHAFNSASHPGSGGATTAAEAITVPSGKGNSAFAVTVAVLGGASPDWVRLNGTDLTLAATSERAASPLTLRADVWLLADPGAGAATLEIHWPTTPTAWSATALTYERVGASPIGATDAASGTDYLITNDVATQSRNAVLLQSVAHEHAASVLSPQGNSTQRSTDDTGPFTAGTSDLGTGMLGTWTPATLATFSGSAPASTLREWTAVAVEIRSADGDTSSCLTGGGGGDPAPATIDFDGSDDGQILDEVWTDSGLGPIGLTGTSDGGPGGNTALVYDSDCDGGCGGGDIDLGTPHQDFGGPGQGGGGGSGQPYENDQAQGGILILAENLVDGDSDGLIDDPDDHGGGGDFLFNFTAIAPVRVLELTAIDVEETAPNAYVELLDGGMNVIATAPMPNVGDNGVTTQALGNTPGVYYLRVVLPGSGAIDNLVILPT